ncbi:related to pre-mRNA splicing factor U2AF large chain [Melanopsichium pennsylvanicum]|uniref:Related to pre-mRNA splicing factor U2AF large chain n=2 Tax=Melanopsichium pennsylvanicum TaxID=63383 RepID=A0AAJ4XU32_9BASI|nr:related to pre-mRNA splicing factor U2AF large chain [Melanopsichium pennsylvanicum 4]SNX87443.1 related to pre-mRNA splicing factor U2AF large chain [Melanopsichium pennsylvanicum]
MSDSAEAFLAGIEDEVRSKIRDRNSSSSARDRDRERDRRDRRSGKADAYDEDRDASSSSSRKRRGDGDDRDEHDRYPRKSQRDDRRDRDRDDDDRRRRRRDDDYHGGKVRGSRDGRDGRDGRDAYSYRRDWDDRYSGRRQRSRYDEDNYYHQRGSQCRSDDWRSAEGRDSSPSVRRSPTPEGTIPISERPRPNTKWDIPAPGFEGTSALAAKATGLFGIPGQTRLVGMPPVNLGVNGPGVPPGVGLPLPPIHMGGQPIHPHRGGPMPPHQHGGRQPYSPHHNQPYSQQQPYSSQHSHHQNQYPRPHQQPHGHGSPHQSQSGFGPNNSSQPQGPSPEELAAQNASRQARRLYVGNITHTANESNIVAFFNEQMLKLKLGTEPGESAMSAQVNVDKGYAFVEFRHPDEATNAMSFDGIVFQAQSLKIRRPKDYTGPDVRPPSNIHVPGVISTNVPDSPQKIFVGGLPTYLTDDQVIELLQAFGELRAFNLVKDTGTGQSKGFAFCEYVDTALTDLACQGLNGMELGDRNLVVQRASVGSEKKAQALAATEANAGAPGTSAVSSAFAGGGGDGGEPTNCMVMLNMITPQELQDDEEYADIVEDIRDECTKYGAVTDVRIPRPAKESKGAAAHQWKRNQDETKEGGSDQGGEREGVGRVYVRYAEIEHCAQALKAIAGRQFGGRMVICAFLKEEDWPGDEDGGENADDTAAQAKGAAFGADGN